MMSSTCREVRGGGLCRRWGREVRSSPTFNLPNRCLELLWLTIFLLTTEFLVCVIVGIVLVSSLLACLLA